jgi:hypothetical protein
MVAQRDARSSGCEGAENSASRPLQRAMDLLLGASRQGAKTVVDEVESEEKMCVRSRIELEKFLRADNI